jgi:hypothetical protein
MSRLRVWAFAALPAAVLAVLIVRLGAADLTADRDPEAALAWWPGHGAANLRLAAREAEEGDRARAETLARRILARSPLAGTAQRVLARVAEHAGDEVRAERHYRIAARRAPRDRPTRAWLTNHAAARGDFATALNQTDQLLRVAPGQLPDALPLLASFAALPEARTALLRLLGEQAPPWRAAFLIWLARQPDALPLIGALFSPLRAAPMPLDARERGAWIDRLQREGRIAEAQFLWIEAQPPERRRRLGNLFDGGFELPPDNAGFGWVFQAVPGATIRREPGTGVGGAQALVVDFHDRRVPFAHVRQRLALPAGRYVLHGRARLDGVRNERGLVWRLRCDGGRLLGDSERFQGSSPWRDFRVDFERPAADCNGQVLELRLDARIAPEQMIGGRVWFDDLRIATVKD